MDKIKELSLPNDVRVIVTSDIHGELELFKRLLERVGFTDQDYLIINGDLCEKGGNSKGTVRYVMELAESHPHVYVTEGNCDTLVEDLLEKDQGVVRYLLKRKHSILNEWLSELGVQIDENTKVEDIKMLLSDHFSDEMKWLLELPTAIATDNYIFVHAGLDDIDDWRETDRIKAIAIPAFLDKSHRADQYVIVGHWPVVNYPSKVPSNNPIINEEKKIIAIDGGNVLKPSGQLNAFIIQRNPGGDRFTYTYVDAFPTTAVLKDYNAEKSMTGCISYPHYSIEPIQQGDHFTLCRKTETGEKVYVKNEYIYQDESNGYTIKSDVSCAMLSVRQGDQVSVIDDKCTGFTLIKKDGVEGWIPKSVI